MNSGGMKFNVKPSMVNFASQVNSQLLGLKNSLNDGVRKKDFLSIFANRSYRCNSHKNTLKFSLIAYICSAFGSKRMK
ncbi:MAG TPA: hypothetical protein DEO71_04810 [Chryseobacterium sp.]|nr:hypothetical protein [Chryseobacterium sp.]